jgi:EAL domain-containing protein (putative c-di-GMP-specific phosphodiesterase class I)
MGYDFSVGLNIGEADLREPGLVDLVADTLRTRDLRPNAVAIEVTETALTSVNSATAKPLLEQFRAAGGYIALDDFGTGNSSITLLKDMPYSSVKIDRSFIRDLTHNNADLAIVRSIVRLSRELGFKIVAEGIETKEQAALLRKLRVDLLQGFLYSRPLPATKLTELLEWASPPKRSDRIAREKGAAA